jgi:hypothetical protein
LVAHVPDAYRHEPIQLGPAGIYDKVNILRCPRRPIERSGQGPGQHEWDICFAQAEGDPAQKSTRLKSDRQAV